MKARNYAYDRTRGVWVMAPTGLDLDRRLTPSEATLAALGGAGVGLLIGFGVVLFGAILDLVRRQIGWTGILVLFAGAGATIALVVTLRDPATLRRPM